ncbi:hypothetical protein EYF80_039830 [Liparis tanakae]|uniref:Uncharacterized protein n=1 Tax=Liparis tanakae TaxID=230148 RepID=A0A4Z2GBE7_9TELE|nr:hypothetical protein EYF80_039830 [Liparis tanakae]
MALMLSCRKCVWRSRLPPYSATSSSLKSTVKTLKWRPPSMFSAFLKATEPRERAGFWSTMEIDGTERKTHQALASTDNDDVTQCGSLMQEEHRGAGEFERSGLLGVQTLPVQVEAVRRVQPGHPARQSHTL